MKKTIAWVLVLALCLSFALVGCSEKKEPTVTESGLDKAAKYLRALYNEAAVETGVDYTRTTVVPVGKVKYTITWSVDVTEDLVKIVAGEGNTVTVDVNEDNQTETAYKLTATVSDAEGKTKTVVFEHILPKAALADGSELTIKEVIEMGAAKEHNTYTDFKYKVTGVITEVYNTQYGNMKLTDTEGNILTIYGTYSADGSARYDAMEVKPVAGDTVTIYGIVGQYNGTPQIKNGWIVAHTPGEGGGDTEPSTPPVDEPADGTEFSVPEIIAMGSAKEHNTYTTNKFKVTGVITEVYNEQYGNMKIKDAAGNILTIYGTYSADGKDRYDAMATKPVAGDTVTIYGVVGQYNGTPQIKNGWIVAHTSAGGSTEPAPTDPPAPPVDEPADGTVLSIKEAIAMGSAKEHNTYTTNKFKVTGVVTEVYNTQYGNMKIKDSEGNILTIYGTYSADGKDRYDAMATKPVAGDTVTVYGIVGQYNDTPQIKNGWIVSHTPGEGSGSSNESVDLSGAKATISFSDVANRTSISEEQQVWTQNGITVTNDRHENTNGIKDYSDPVRFYKLSKVTIAYSGMKKIAVVCGSADYAAALQGAAEAEGLTATVSGETVIIELSKATDSVSIVISVGQVRVASIAVFTA